MYQAHHLLSTPPDDTKLWRYLDLSHFLWLLSRKSLYFANLGEFLDDKWEGTLPETTIQGLKRFLRIFAEKHGERPPKEEAEREALRSLMSAVKSLQPMYVVNCWHRNDVESVAMWTLYTKGMDGVAIQSTVGRLKTCLSHERRSVYIARVKYGHAVPEDGLISPHALMPIITKRRSFEHESEVRLVLDRYSSVRPAADELSRQSKGEAIAVDLSTLIEKIVASPYYPEWAKASLQDRVADAGLNLMVEESDLLKLPEADKIPYVSRRAD
jgi:hypothetical protein